MIIRLIHLIRLIKLINLMNRINLINLIKSCVANTMYYYQLTINYYPFPISPKELLQI